MKSRLWTVLALSAVMLTAFSCSGAEEEIPVNKVNMTVNVPSAGKFKNSNIKSNAETEAQAERKTRPGRERCRDHKADYHWFPDELVEYIGQEKFDKWSRESYSESQYVLEGDCSFSLHNIVACLEYFEIPKEKFEKIYYENNYFYRWEYDPDMLYREDKENIQWYFGPYENSDVITEIEYRSALGLCKSRLAREVGKYTSDAAVKKKYDINPYSTWTMEEYIHDTGIFLEDFSKVLEPYHKLKQVLLPEEVFARAEKYMPDETIGDDLEAQCERVMLDEMRVYGDKDIESNDMCHVHTGGYHSYTSALIDYIGSDKFYEWAYYMSRISDPDLTDRCPYSGRNIIACIEYFGITKEEFDKIYTDEMCEYEGFDIDVMFSGDEAAIKNLFTEPPYIEENGINP